MIDRRDFMESQFFNLGLQEIVERFPAVDATKVSIQPPPAYVPGRWNGSRWELSCYHIAVFESHRRLWSKIVDLELPYALIFEDDVVISKDLTDLIAGIDPIVENVDVIKVDAIVSRRRFGPKIRVGNFGIRSIVEQPLYSAAGYLISQDGARYLVDLSARYSDGLDYFVFIPRCGYRLFQIFPALAIQGVFLDNKCINGKDVPLSGVPSLGALGQVPSRGPIPFRAMREFRRGVRRIRRFTYGDRDLVSSGGMVGKIPLADDLRTEPLGS